MSIATLPTPAMHRRLMIVLASALGAIAAPAATAQSLPSTLAGTGAVPVDPKSPCAAADYHQLDFWIGDWRVFDGKTGRLVAHDRIRPLYGHCVIQQQMRFEGDLYRRPGTPFPLAGLSISRFDGQQWLQMWVDNQWGAIMMKGSRRPDGAIQLDTILPSRGRDVRLVWHAEPGEVRIEQMAAKGGSGDWERYEDLIYRPDHR